MKHKSATLIHLLTALFISISNSTITSAFKCHFELSWSCTVTPDSSSIPETHLYNKTDSYIDQLKFNGTYTGIPHPTQSELTPFCRRFQNLDDIRINSVKSLDVNLFQNCQKVDKIWIEETDLEELPEDIFKYLKKLVWLYLDRNQISNMPSNIFKSLINLIVLDLSSNQIQELNPKWFESFRSLTNLWLSDNKIQELPKSVFARMRKLQDLDLNRNQLTVIHSSSFGFLGRMNRISLRDNKVNEIDEKVIDYTAVKWIDMNGNVCGNETFEVRKELKEELRSCFGNYQPRENSSKLWVSCPVFGDF